MPITPALQMVTWGLLFTSLSILLVAELLSPWLIAAGYAVIGISAARVRLGSSPWLSSGVWQVLTVTALLIFVVEWVILLNGLLAASLHLLLYLMFYKLLTLDHSRDYLHLYLIGFFQLLASTTAVAELPYGAIFFIYVILAPWTLMLYTLQLEAEQQATLGQLPVIRWPFFLTTTATAVGTFVLTFAIFFLIPRMGSGYLQQAGPEPIKLVGFSERVDLGTIGAVKLDQTVVMRAGIQGSLPTPLPTLYWRGTAYDYYDGASWQNRLGTRWSVTRRSDGWFELPAGARGRARPDRLVHQEIFLEPLETSILFAASDPTAVSNELPALRTDGQSTLLLPLVPAAQLRYEVESVLPWLESADRSVTLADYRRIPTAYLQLPDGTERVIALARQIVGLGDGQGPASLLPTQPARSVFEQATRIEQHLKQEYRYTLDVTPPRQLSAIDDFLFVQKAGYCEYYATAMVLMLRGLGIPARLSSGFLQGEWNNFGRYFTVRQQDAHTWVEVYFPQSGWYPFDPTPAVAGASAGLFGRIGQLIDTMRLTWDRYILRYSVRDQLAVMREMREQGSTWQVRSAQWLDDAKAAAGAVIRWMFRHREPFLMGAAVGCFAFLVMRWWMQRHGHWPLWKLRPLRRLRQRGQTFYANMLRELARHGLHKPSSMTPLEFLHDRAVQLGSAAPVVASLTEYYNHSRFGARALSQEERLEVTRLLRELREPPVVAGVSAHRPSEGPSQDQ